MGWSSYTKHRFFWLGLRLNMDLLPWWVNVTRNLSCPSFCLTVWREGNVIGSACKGLWQSVMHDSAIGIESGITLLLVGIGIKKINLCWNRNHAFKLWNRNQGFANIGYPTLKPWQGMNKLESEPELQCIICLSFIWSGQFFLYQNVSGKCFYMKVFIKK